GKLVDSAADLDDAARQLVDASKREKNDQEGAFLGALLRVRYGPDLKDHVKKVMLRWKERSESDGMLLKAFAYIAAMHAENLLILSKSILAEALGCRLVDLKPQYIGPLGTEAVESSEQYVLTRH